MSAIDELRMNVDLTPIYAAVGITDLAVEKAREAREHAAKVTVEVRADLEPATVQRRATNAVEQAKELPAAAVNGSLTAAGKVAESYEALAERGQHLIERIRNQQATQDLVHQAESTVARSKGAVTTARHAATDVERSAKATITTGRKEAAHVVDTLADSVAEEARLAREEIKASAARTRTAARRTDTTTTKATKRTRSSAKGAVTSARKTTKAGTKATKKAAEKVGA